MLCCILIAQLAKCNRTESEFSNLSGRLSICSTKQHVVCLGDQTTARGSPVAAKKNTLGLQLCIYSISLTIIRTK